MTLLNLTFGFANGGPLLYQLNLENRQRFRGVHNRNMLDRVSEFYSQYGVNIDWRLIHFEGKVNSYFGQLDLEANNSEMINIYLKDEPEIKWYVDNCGDSISLFLISDINTGTIHLGPDIKGLSYKNYAWVPKGVWTDISDNADAIIAHELGHVFGAPVMPGYDLSIMSHEGLDVYLTDGLVEEQINAIHDNPDDLPWIK